MMKLWNLLKVTFPKNGETSWMNFLLIIVFWYFKVMRNTWYWIFHLHTRLFTFIHYALTFTPSKNTTYACVQLGLEGQWLQVDDLWDFCFLCGQPLEKILADHSPYTQVYSRPVFKLTDHGTSSGKVRTTKNPGLWWFHCLRKGHIQKGSSQNQLVNFKARMWPQTRNFFND